MTEAEAFEIALLAASNAITAFTVYITFTFGYLAAAYFVGKKAAQAPTFYPAGTINEAGFWRLYVGALLGVGILASLYFMWSARRSE